MQTERPDSESLGDILSRMSDRFINADAPQDAEQPKSATADPAAVASLPATSNDVHTPDYVRIETSLETVGYFQAGYKRTYPQPREKRTVTMSGNRKLEFLPNATLGYPNTEDLDFYRGFQKLCAKRVEMVQKYNKKTKTNEWHPQLQVPIAFSTNELLRASGRMKNKRNIQAVKDFLHRQVGHMIRGQMWNAKQQRYEEFYGSLFREGYTRGEKKKNGNVAEAHIVIPSQIFLTNFYHYYSKQVDLGYYRSLRKPIAKGLWQVLEEGWYAAINNGGYYWEKRYRDLCNLLSITPHKHLSKIKEQLEPAHRDLNDYKHKRDDRRFLEKWEYRKSAKDDGDYIIRYYPSRKFFIDQAERRREADEKRQIISADNRPSLDEVRQMLLAEVVSFCGDFENEPAYYSAVRNNPRTLIERVLADTRLADREKRIKSTKGAYFMDTLKRFAA